MILYITARLTEERRELRSRLLEAGAGVDRRALTAAVLGVERKLLDIRDYVAGVGPNLQSFTFWAEAEQIRLAFMPEELETSLPVFDEEDTAEETALESGMTLPLRSAKRQTAIKWLPREEDSLLEWLVRLRKEGLSGNLFAFGGSRPTPLIDLPYGHFPVQ